MSQKYAIIVTFTKRKQKMKDANDNMTPELPGISETVTKKRGRPPAGHKSRTAAERKRDQRARMMTSIIAPESEGGKSWQEWTLAECLHVLADPKLRRTDGLDAHKRLGLLLQQQDDS
jgi:hypothetical protein